MTGTHPSLSHHKQKYTMKTNNTEQFMAYKKQVAIIQEAALSEENRLAKDTTITGSKLKTLVKAISIKATAKEEKLARKYAFLNNKVKIGNTVEDQLGTIIVENISVYNKFDPACVYNGLMLTDKGIAYKSGERRCIYQSNLQSINGETVKK